MSGRASRDKGARGEREFAELLSNELGQVVKRKLGQARDGGDDIQVGRYRIEVKRREKLAIEVWCKQVEAACTVAQDIDQDGRLAEPVPVVVFRRNGEPWRAVVPAAWLIAKIRDDL
jgi:Holliday junction resolvase